MLHRSTTGDRYQRILCKDRFQALGFFCYLGQFSVGCGWRPILHEHLVWDALAGHRGWKQAQCRDKVAVYKSWALQLITSSAVGLGAEQALMGADRIRQN